LQFQDFLGPGNGFFEKNWGMSAHVNLMFHPMGWGGHHITHAQNREVFDANASRLQAQNQGLAALQWVGCQ
jgi:hypothetical protein